MNKKPARLLAVCLIISMMLILTGCPREPKAQNITETVNFKFCYMPWDANGLYAYLECLDNSQKSLGKAVELGVISQTEQTFTGKVDASASYIKCWLKDKTTGSNKYSCTLELNGALKSSYDVPGWWKIEYTTGKALCPEKFGISMGDMQDGFFGSTAAMDFDGYPYVFLKFSGVKNEKILISSASYNTAIYYSTDLNKILTQDKNLEMATNGLRSYYKKEKYITPDKDDLYVFIRPYNYDYADESECIVEFTNVSDISSSLIDSSTIREVQFISDNEILFAETDSYLKGRKLYTQNITTGVTTQINTGATELDGIVKYLTPYGGGCFFAAGKDIWYLDSAKNATTVYTLSGTSPKVVGMCLYDEDKLFVLDGDIIGTYATPKLFNIESGGSLTANQTGTPTVKKGEDFFYLNGKVLYVNADSDLQTVWWSGSTMNTRAMGTTVQGPLKQFGSYVMTGSGYTYQVADTSLSRQNNKSISAESYFQNFNRFTDIEIDGSSIYTLYNEAGGSASYGKFVYITVWDTSNLSKPVGELVLWDKQGADLEVRNGKLYITWTSGTKMDWDSDNDYFQVGTTCIDLE